jgi:hypothetical protein
VPWLRHACHDGGLYAGVPSGISDIQVSQNDKLLAEATLVMAADTVLEAVPDHVGTVTVEACVVPGTGQASLRTATEGHAMQAADVGRACLCCVPWSR